MREALDAPNSPLIDACHGDLLPRYLTRSAPKQRLFAVDPYFYEMKEEMEDRIGSLNLTVVWRWASLMLKPDAFACGAAVRLLLAVRAAGLSVVWWARVALDRHQVRALWSYQWNILPRDRWRLLDDVLVARTSLHVLLVGPPDTEVPASVHLSALKGPTPVSRRLPHHLRHSLGHDNPVLNALHVADEPADVMRELAILHVAGRRDMALDALLKGEAAGEAFDAVVAAAARLQGAAPWHDLSLEGSLGTLSSRISASRVNAALPYGPPNRRAGSALAAFRNELTVWETLALRAYVVGDERAGRRNLIPGVGEAEWRTGWEIA